MRMIIVIALLGILLVRGERDETASVSAPARTGAWAKRIGVPVPMPVPVPSRMQPTWYDCSCQGICGCCGALARC